MKPRSRARTALSLGLLCAPGLAQEPAGPTLFAPQASRTTYLIDADGEIVHRWESDTTPGYTVYLLEDGSLLRTGRRPADGVFRGGGQGGLVQRIAPDGTLLWEFDLWKAGIFQHHDVEPVPGGNVLVLAWEHKTEEQVRAAGRDPERLTSNGMWPDQIVEIEPRGRTGGAVVWEWHAWDHLIQDHDPRAANHGDVAAHPERIDINGELPGTQPNWEVLREQSRLAALGYGGGDDEDEDGELDERWGPGLGDWTHTNSVAYHPELDQIVLSVRNFSELWIIDHGTTTREAAGHAGGRRGKGGDLLYRWGNPAAYRAGTREDRRLFLQHDVRWIPPGHPGEGNLLVFNNGEPRVRPDSSVDEIRPPLDAEGGYLREAGRAFGPAEPLWSCTAAGGETFFSRNISGAQRLSDGNTLVCDGEAARLFEVDREGALVWEYSAAEEGLSGSGGVFRATRLAFDDPGVRALLEVGERSGPAPTGDGR